MVDDESEKSYDPSTDDVVTSIMSESSGSGQGPRSSERKPLEDGRLHLDDTDGAVNPYIDGPRPKVKMV